MNPNASRQAKNVLKKLLINAIYSVKCYFFVESSKLVVIIGKILPLYTVYLLLGSNKGDKRKFLLLAQYFIQHHAGTILKTSAIYETEPWGKSNQAKYLNQAICISTDKTPFQLLKVLQKIEKKLGRVNKHNNSARTIDIDILFYEDIILKSKNLEIPHPRLHMRNFTLQPMLELNKSYTHPVFHKSIEELSKDCADTLKVSIFDTKTKTTFTEKSI